jgi:uncharacterized protein
MMASIFGKGISFPPRLDGYGRLAWSEGETNIRESIAVILKTNHRERIALPGFGAGLQRYLFEPNSLETHTQITHDIDMALRKYEPRIALEDVVVAADPQSAQTAIATITYRLVASGLREKISVNVPLGGQG